MARAYRLRAVVEAGHKISVIAPEVEIGQSVEVIVVEEAAADAAEQKPQPLLEYLDSRPRRSYSAERWAEIEADFQRERDAWDR